MIGAVLARCTRMKPILVVEDTDSLREVLASVLSGEGFTVTAVPSAEEAIELLTADSADFRVVLCDLKLPRKTGLDLLREIAGRPKRIPVVVMTAYGSIDIAVEAMKLGAADFVTKPFDPVVLCNLLDQVIEHQRIIDRDPHSSRRPRQLVTQARALEELMRQARKVAPLSSPVMLLGESGTGKELIARYIHENSSRSGRPFVAVNCGSMPEELLESEFFGHEAGAFTGAIEQRIGLFEVANGGTIFLDEIGTMPPNLQVKLLRTLQESEIKRLGANTVRSIDVRIISATNAPIERAITEGAFREDLYYRLGVVILEVPPLRERKEDISLLANYFLKSLRQAGYETPAVIPDDALEVLLGHDWPGNVRELENVIERAVIFHGAELDARSLKLPLKPASAMASLQEIANAAAQAAEVEAIREALGASGGNKSEAARRLGVSYKTLLHKVRAYHL